MNIKFALFRRKINLHRLELRKAESVLEGVRKGDRSQEIEGWLRSSLKSSNWEVRNIAVKIVGIIAAIQFRDELIAMLDKPTEIGFIRRNCASALMQLNTNDPRIVNSLLKAIEDDYYEVRVQSALSLGVLGAPDAIVEKKIIEMIFRTHPDSIPTYPIWFPSRIYRERNFEVRTALTAALGTFAISRTSLHALELLLHDSFWKVREAAIKAYVPVAIRIGVTDDHIHAILSEVDLTCPEFRPVFPIRETWNQMIQDSEEKSEVEMHPGGH